MFLIDSSGFLVLSWGHNIEKRVPVVIVHTERQHSKSGCFQNRATPCENEGTISSLYLCQRPHYTPVVFHPCLPFSHKGMKCFEVEQHGGWSFRFGYQLRQNKVWIHVRCACYLGAQRLGNGQQCTRWFRYSIPIYCTLELLSKRS